MADIKNHKLTIPTAMMVHYNLTKKQFFDVMKRSHARGFRSTGLFIGMMYLLKKFYHCSQEGLLNRYSKKIKQMESEKDGFAIVTYLCHRDVKMFLISTRSLYDVAEGKKLRVIVYDDGTLSESDRALLQKKISRIEIFNIYDEINNSKTIEGYENLKKYLKHQWKSNVNILFYYKVAIAFLMQDLKVKRVFYRDADVFLQKKPDFFEPDGGEFNLFCIDQALDGIENNPQAIHYFPVRKIDMNKYVSVFDPKERFELFKGIQVPKNFNLDSRINSGAMVFSTQQIIGEAIDTFIGNLYILGYDKGSFFNSEQLIYIFAMLMGKNRAWDVDNYKVVSCVLEATKEMREVMIHFPGIAKIEFKRNIYHTMGALVGSRILMPLLAKYVGFVLRRFERYNKACREGLYFLTNVTDGL